MPILRRIAATAAMLFMFALMPLIVSLPFPHYGWGNGIPGLWNETGLVLVLPGLILLTWAIRAHTTSAPEQRNLDITPNHLLIQGPYRFTRNPMYLAYLLFWLAWAVFYGSISVMAGLAVLSALAQFMLVPREERTLEAKFGEEYRRYKKRVPRWFRLRNGFSRSQ